MKPSENFFKLVKHYSKVMRIIITCCNTRFGSMKCPQVGCETWSTKIWDTICQQLSVWDLPAEVNMHALDSLPAANHTRDDENGRIDYRLRYDELLLSLRLSFLLLPTKHWVFRLHTDSVHRCQLQCVNAPRRDPCTTDRCRQGALCTISARCQLWPTASHLPTL